MRYGVPKDPIPTYRLRQNTEKGLAALFFKC